MKRGKSVLSFYLPKKPPEGLKTRVIEAAMGATGQPIKRQPFFKTLDWGLLAASLILAAALALMSGVPDPLIKSQETQKGMATEEALMMKNAGLPASGTPRVSFRKKIVVLNPDEIGG